MSFANTHTPLKPTGKAKHQVQLVRNEDTGAMSYEMNEEQQKLFVKLFPIRFNSELMELFGISFSTLQRFRRKLGLKKNRAVIRRKLTQAIKKTCESNGYYESLRGKRPSDACMEATAKLRADGFNPLREFMQRHPKKYAEMRKRCGEERKRVLEKERQRVDWGLPQQTRLLVPFAQYSRKQINMRCSMKQRGYTLGDMRGDDRWTIYYVQETNRSTVMERHAAAMHFTIKEYKP